MSKNRTAAFLALALVGTWGQAGPAQPTGELACQPGSLKAMVQNQRLRIEGELEVPTPGYSYNLSRGNRSGKTRHFHLVLYPPNGPAPSVIGSVDIEEAFKLEEPIRRIEIAIEKDFNWGPERIVCEREL